MKKLFYNLYILILSFSIILGFAFSCNIALSFNAKQSNNAFAQSDEIQTTVSVPVTAVTYEDNKGYEDGVIENRNVAFNKNYLNLRINTNSDAVAIEDMGNNNFVIDISKGNENSSIASISIDANYNFNSTTNIIDHWDLSSDTAQNILGFDNMGEVGTGAFIVETSYDGKNYNQTSSALKTVNVTEAFSPSLYNTSNNKYKQVYIPSGKDINKGVYIRIRFAYEVFRTTYSYYDFSEGKPVVNSYEKPQVVDKILGRVIKNVTYYNILETATFYIANNTGNVGFHNLTNNIERIKDDLLDKMVSQVYFSNVNQENHEKNDFELKYSKYLEGQLDENNNEITFSRQEKFDYYNIGVKDEDKLDNKKLTLIANQYYQGETLRSGDMTFSGFSLDNLGNDNYIVRYQLNGVDMGQMSNGELFLENGRYDIYVSTPWEEDKTHYTIYVNDRSNSATLADYFDNNFISDSSKRIYDIESTLPVFVQGSIFYQIKNSENNVPLSGKITKYNDDETMQDVYTFLYDDLSAEGYEQAKNVILNKNANNTGSLDLEPGYYYATFFTTTNFIDGITGDYYTISYMFKVVDKDSVSGPIVNQTILNSFSNVSRFNSKYYGVEQKNVNNKTITFAFFSQESAYNFAYQLESDKVIFKNGTYNYDNKTYTSSALLGKDLNDNALSLIKVKYFDASDFSTYLTLKEQSYDQVAQEGEEANLGESILELEYVNQDIVVFVSDEIETNTTPIPFLNDGNVAFVNADGTISQTKTDMQFISVSNYESNQIKVINIDTEQEYVLSYDENIESQLIAYHAPSGNYKIVETNLYGDNTSDTSVYYATYIAQENTSNALITYLYNDEIITTTIDKSKNNIVLNANSLIIENITNKLDPYSIVKITYGSETKIMSIAELSNYKIDKSGNYNIEIVDRLANQLSFTVNINNAVDAVILNYDDGTTQSAFVGYSIILKEGQLKNNYDFMGWTYETLDNEYTKAITPTQNQDINLTAVYHHSVVNITFNDGDFAQTIQAKPEDTIDFDTNTFSKQGYELVGFMWNDGTQNILYTYRISSVPNVEYMDIYALYKKAQNEVEVQGTTLVDGDFVYTNAEHGTAFPQIDTPSDMKFVGWMQLDVEGGVIYKNIIPNLDGDVVLSAVYEKLETQQNTDAGTLQGAGTINDKNNNDKFTKVLLNKSIICSICFVLFAIYFVLNKRQKQTTIKNKIEIKKQIINDSKSSVNSTKITAEIKENNKIKINKRNNKKFFIKSIFKRKNIKYLTASLCFVLAFILGTQGILANIAKLRVQNAIKTSYEQSILLQQDEMYGNLQDSVEEIKQDISANQNENLSDEDDNRIQEIHNVSNTLAQEENETSEFSMTDDEAFLYSEVIVDLTTLGYSVFPASVKFNDQTVYGIAYTTGETVFENENEKDVVYIGTGFTAFLNQTPITDYAIEQGLTITPLQELDDYDDDSEDQTEIKYILSFEESYIDQETNTILYNHYIQNNLYVHYALYDYQFHATFTQIDDLTSLESLIDKKVGKLYSYDDGYVVYDPYWEKEQAALDSIFATAINNTATKEQTKLLYNSFVESQDANYLSVEKGTSIYYSTVNLNEIYLQLQQESILGITAEQWRDVENQLSEGVYYYIVEKQETDEDGNLLWIDENGEKTTTETDTPSMVPDIEYSLYPKPTNWVMICFGVLLIVGGIAISVLSMGTGSSVGAAVTSIGLKTILTNVLIFTLSAVSGFAIDVGLQSIIIGAVGGSVSDINWKRAIISSGFNLLTMGADKIFKAVSLGGKIIKGVALTVLEGFVNYMVEVACGSTQTKAWEEFGWGVLLGFIFNSIDIISYVRAMKKLKKSEQIIDDISRAISKSNVDDTAADLIQDANSGIKKLDDQSQKYLSKTLPSHKKANYYDLNNNVITKKEFIENGANGTIEWKNTRTLLFDKNGNPITKLKIENGVIDLSPLSHDTLNYSYLSDLDFSDRVTNLNRAYKDLTDMWNNDPASIPYQAKVYMQENGIRLNKINFLDVKKICSGKVYTLHETVEKTIMLIPTNMHKAISHIGGIALYGTKSKMPEILKNIIKGALNKW